eukprot:TRINITY_DN361_c0_g1_i2.p1 TRINITY_DN361_c0_g1~~TRINITY_DN361_c0_g1_i2.p1  ORF type:complete len:398 (+),score=85.14 TRINITY_DN361_c0_g1_i2:245-1438(+)
MNQNIMIMELLGPSLEDLFSLCSRKFSTKTVLMLADQMISRVEFLHSRNFIHRDIKPDNFLIGLQKKSNVVYLIDLGLAKKYRDAKTHQHIPYKENKNLTGTARYASINAHLGIEQSRRDDLESIGYVMVYLLKGFLPWQGIKANNKQEKYHKIMEKKMTTPIEILCKGLSIEFSIFLNYCRSLKFDDKPDYRYLRKLFKDLFIREEYEWDYMYDWALMAKEGKAASHSNGKIQIYLNSAPDGKVLDQSKLAESRAAGVNGSTLLKSVMDNTSMQAQDRTQIINLHASGAPAEEEETKNRDETGRVNNTTYSEMKNAITSNIILKVPENPGVSKKVSAKKLNDDDIPIPLNNSFNMQRDGSTFVGQQNNNSTLMNSTLKVSIPNGGNKMKVNESSLK